MATDVDKRIVEMQFDNAQFEKGVSTSLQSLENLKKGLNLESAISSISNIEKAFNKIDFSGISNGIDEIKGHFTTLGRNIDTIIDNIVQSAVSKLSSIGKSISVDQIGAGFEKYDTQTRAVQTITNATGKSVEEVGQVLGKLQKYTDETSYDFAEMATTIGKFTSVGVELERAETAMEGIANVAAVSGAGKAEANRAMYNFAQSLSQGSVKLMDWKSIENANMATKEFKEELIKTAISLGTINKTSETTGNIMKQTKAATKKTAAQFKETAVDYKTFNSTLSEGWLTSDVLITTLERYANKEEGVGKKAYEAAQKALTYKDAMDAIKDAVSSSWMQSFQYIFGDLNEAINLWTGFCNAIIEVTDSIGSYRNEILKGWHEQGGYNSMIEAASNIWTAFRNVLDLVRDSFNSVIPPATADTLVNLTNRVKDFSEELKNFFNYNGIIEVEEEVEKLVNYAGEFTDNIVAGMSGDYVKLFQQALINAGYSLDKFGADGIYGKETKNAIKALQKDLGVEQTGEWDEATRKAAILSGKFQAIEKVTETVTKKIGDVYEVEGQEVEKIVNLGHQLPQKLLQEGDVGDDVLELQKALVKMGYLDEKLADGIYGPKTKAAVAQLQKDYNLTQESGVGVFDIDMRDQIIDLELYTDKVKTVGTEIKTVGAQNTYMERLQNVIKGLAARWSIFTNLISLGGKIINHVISLFSPIADAILTIASAIGKCWVSLNNYLNETGAYEKWFNNVKKFLEPVGNLLQSIGDSINAFFERHKDAETFGDLWNAVISEFQEIPIIKTIWEKVTPVADSISKFFSSIRTAVINFFTADTSGEKTILEKLKKRFSAFASIGEWFSNTFSNPFEGITDDKKNGLIAFLKWIFNGISSILRMITKMDFKQLLTAAVGIFAAVKVFKGITTLLSPIKALKNISGMFESIGDFFDTSSKAVKKKSAGSMILKIAASLLLISVAVAILASLDTKKAWNAVGILAAISGILIVFSVLMNKFVEGGINKSTKGLLKLSIGLILMATAVSMLAKLPADSLIRGLAGIAAILLEIIIYSKLMGNDTKVAGFVSLAAGVLLLTVSMKKLSGMSWNEILKGLVGLGAILLELAIFIKIVNGNGLNTGLISMVGVGVAVYLLANSFKSLSELSWESIIKGIAALGAVLLELAIFIKIVNGSKSVGLLKMVGIGVAITLIAKSFKDLGSMSWDGILKGVVALGAIFLEIAIFIKLIKKNNPISLLAAAISTIAIGAALLLFVEAIRGLARIKLQYLVKAVVALGVIFAEIIVFMNLIKKNNPLSMIASMLSLVVLGLTLKLFVDAIASLASMNIGSLLKGVIALGVLFTEISVFMNTLSHISINLGVIISLIGAAALIAVLAGSLIKIAEVPWSTIIAFGVTFSLVISSISSALVLLSLIPITGAISAVANLAIFIAGLMAVFSAIGALEKLTNGGLSDWLTTGAQVLGSAIGTFIASIVEPFRKTTDTKSTKTTTSFTDYLNNMVSGLNGVMDQLEPFLNRVSAITEDQVNGVMNLVKVLALMSGEEILDSISGWISSALNGGEGSGSGFVDFAMSLVQVVPYLKQFSEESGSIDVYGLKVAAVAMGYFSNVATAVLPMSGAQVLDAIAAFISGEQGESAFVNFASKLVQLAPKLVLFGSLAKAIDTDAIVNAVPAVEAFGKLASAVIPMTVGEVIDAIAAFISGEQGESAFLNFASKLIELAPKLVLFGTLANSIDSNAISNAVSAVEAFGSIASATIAMTKSEVIDAIGAFISGEAGESAFLSFADKMALLAPKLSMFGLLSKTIDSTAITNALPAITAFGDMASTAAGISWNDMLSGIADFIGGKDTLTDFADKMIAFGPKLMEFGNAIDGLDEDKATKMQSAANVLSSFASVANEIPGTDGLVQKIFGEHNIEDFGSKLTALGEGLYNFYDKTKDIPSGYDSSGIVDALKGLVGIAQEVPGAGGFVQAVVGEKDLDSFGSSLETLGNGLNKFYDSTKGIPSDYNSEAMVAALKGLVGIAQEVPGAGGFVQAVVGEKDLDSFGSSLETLGNGLNKFYDSTKDISTDYDATAPLAVLTALSNLESGLEEHGGIKQWFTGEKDIGVFGEQVASLGTNLETFFTKTQNVDAQKLKDIGTALDTLSTAVQNTPDSQILASGIGGLQYAIDALAGLNYDGFIETGKQVVTNVLTGVQTESANKRLDIIKSGADVMSYVSSGITSKETELKEKFVTILNNLYRENITEDSLKKFKWLGWQLDWGLANGIRDKSDSVSGSFGWVVRQAYERGRREAGIESPSKLTAWLGEMMDMGLVKGLEEYSGRVYDSASFVSDQAISGAQKGLSDFSSLVFDEMPDEPVIRPVLDLSEVQAGVAGMNGMFGTQTVGVRSAAIASSIAADTARNEMRLSASTDNTDIKGTLEVLNSRIDELGQRISNMKVVTETGALVGQITNGIDRSLGKKAMLASRGA